MSIYSDYTEEEQSQLRGSLEAAAIAVSAASPGRKEETASEGYAAAEFIMGSQAEYVSNTLVTSMLVKVQSLLDAGHVFPDFVKVAMAPGALEEAMTDLRRVAQLLDAKATPEEGAGFKRWLLEIAQVTAKAGKEDQGFLGHGGVQVNDAERAALAQIAGVLGIEA